MNYTRATMHQLKRSDYDGLVEMIFDLWFSPDKTHIKAVIDASFCPDFEEVPYFLGEISSVPAGYNNDVCKQGYIEKQWKAAVKYLRRFYSAKDNEDVQSALSKL